MEKKASFILYLMRHGQTMANMEQRYLGSSESPLTEVGLSQHEKICNQLKDIDFSRIYSSPRKRCLSLADSLAGDYGAIIEDRRIQEMDFGVFEQMQWQEASEKYPEVWEKYKEMDPDFFLPEGESLSGFEERITDFVDELMTGDLSGAVAVVSHGGVATTLICRMLGLDLSERWRFRLENGHVAKIQVQDGFAYLVL